MKRIGIAVLLVAVIIGTGIPAAFGHAEVRERAPAAGQTLGGRVDHIDLSFLAPIEAASITLAGPDGRPVEVGDTVIRRNGLVVSVEFEPLTDPGAYTVTHEERAADGDEQRAAYRFVYDPDAEDRLASLIERDTGPNWLLLGIIGVVVMVGLLLFAPWRR